MVLNLCWKIGFSAFGTASKVRTNSGEVHLTRGIQFSAGQGKTDRRMNSVQKSTGILWLFNCTGCGLLWFSFSGERGRKARKGEELISASLTPFFLCWVPVSEQATEEKGS